ncbi:uncharacterized protein [Nicotiana tomentosiformis]|uniref:uncharacterized protein n=1 Tax=Nicotiana tomentosiformis TaxID=4098 RepID=UPI00388C98DA
MQVFRDELEEKDNELVKAIEKCSVLEGTLKNKEKELQISRGVEAQCSDLQAQLEALNGEVAEKQSKLEKAKSSHLDARRKLEMLELANRALQAERENDQSTTKAKEDRLEERRGELEKDNSILHDRVAALEAEKAQLLALPSSSRTSYFPNVPRELYEEWIHAKAHLDVFRGFYPSHRLLSKVFVLRLVKLESLAGMISLHLRPMRGTMRA